MNWNNGFRQIYQTENPFHKSYYEKFADGTVKCIDKEIPFEIPESWEWVRWRTVFQTNPKNDIEDGLEVSFVPMAYIKEGYSNEAKFDIKQWKDIKSGFTHFQNNDLGIAKITPCFENRKSVIFKNLHNIHGAGTTELHIFRPLVFPILAQYALYIAKSEDFILNGVANFSGAVGQQRVGKDIIGDYLIALPPLEEISKILSAVSELFLIVDGIEKDKMQLSICIQNFKSKILDLAIRGKLVPQDPNDEPASVLLERIKAEHPASKKKTKNISDNSHYENLPQGWAECTLENIGSWSSGATPSRSNKMYYINGTVNWLKTGDLNDGYVDCIPEKITDLALKECSVRLNPKDSVLIAMLWRDYRKNWHPDYSIYHKSSLLCMCHIFRNIQ